MKKSKKYLLICILLGLIFVLLAVFDVFAFMNSRMPAIKKSEIKEISSEEMGDSEKGLYEASVNDIKIGDGNIQTPAPATEQQQAEANPDYLLPDSTRALTDADIQAAISANSAVQLPAGSSLPQMMINEMYAKHGYRFQSQEIQSYFDGKFWYQGTSSDMQAVDSAFSQIEKDNVNLLKKYR